jgi:hypothetical protein
MWRPITRGWPSTRSISSAVIPMISEVTLPRLSRYAALFMPADGTPTFQRGRDVLQLNAFDADLRQAVVQTVSSIAQQCDAIRCDMAMLKPESFFEASPELHGPPTYFTLGCHGRASRFNVLPLSTRNS